MPGNPNTTLPPHLRMPSERARVRGARTHRQPVEGGPTRAQRGAGKLSADGAELARRVLAEDIEHVAEVEGGGVHPHDLLRLAAGADAQLALPTALAKVEGASSAVGEAQCFRVEGAEGQTRRSADRRRRRVPSQAPAPSWPSSSSARLSWTSSWIRPWSRTPPPPPPPPPPLPLLLLLAPPLWLPG